MSRRKLEIDRSELESAIQTIESDLDNLPKNHSDLFKRISDHLGLNSPGSVAGRIRDYGLLDTLKTKPGRVCLPSGEAERPKRRGDMANPNVVSIDCEPFLRRGLRVETLADLVPAPSKDDDINLDIIKSWREVRLNSGLDFLSLNQYKNVIAFDSSEEIDYCDPNKTEFSAHGTPNSVLEQMEKEGIDEEQ